MAPSTRLTSADDTSGTGTSNGDDDSGNDDVSVDRDDTRGRPRTPVRRLRVECDRPLSTVLHLVALGRRPLAHDEAIDAWFSWQARNLGVMKYDPVYHGPLRFYLEGIVLDTFGTSAGWARLVAALAGVAMTIVIAGSVRLLGRTGAPLAALLFTISPTVLTVTRTGRAGLPDRARVARPPPRDRRRTAGAARSTRRGVRRACSPRA